MPLRIQRLAAICAIVACTMLVGPSVSGQTTASVAFYSEALAPHGYWFSHPRYGWVWKAKVSGDWRPYTYGRWVWTSEYGWLWVSEEDWGWVVYHYGRWVWTSDHGWVWVPGDVWGPSWVEWCYSDGYIGWTPMPPEPAWRGDVYYASFDCSAPAYRPYVVYVHERHFAGPSISAHVVASSQINLATSTNITRYSRIKGAVVNRSIDVAKLRATTGQKISPVRILHANGAPSPTAKSRSASEITVYRPDVTADLTPTLDLRTPQPLNLESPRPDFSVQPAESARGLLPAEGSPVREVSPSIQMPNLGRGDSVPGTGAIGGLRGRLGK
jgi:hypothetical protein